MTTRISPQPGVADTLPAPAMKTSLLMLALMALALSLSGCGRTVVKESKETIREQPVQVVEHQKEIIVEKPVMHQILVEQPFSTPQRVCTYSSSVFSPGTLSCQSGQQVRCEDGVWIARGAC